MDKEQYSLMYRIEDTHWWYSGMRDISRALISSRNPTPNGRSDRVQTVLDAGCGTGGSLAHLPPGFVGTGIDYSPDALDLARQRGIILLAQASVENLPFEDGAFDFALCSDVIYHLGVQHDLQALEELYRVLRPGGLAVVRVAAYDWLRGAHDTAVHTRHRYTRNELRVKMAAAGFQTERVTYANSLLFPLALAKRALEGRMTQATSELEETSLLEQLTGRAALWLESRLVSKFDLPFGLSIIAVGRKLASPQLPGQSPAAHPFWG